MNTLNYNTSRIFLNWDMQLFLINRSKKAHKRVFRKYLTFSIQRQYISSVNTVQYVTACIRNIMKRNGTVSYSHVFVSRRSVECQLVKTLPSFFIMFGLIWIFSWSCLNRNHMIILYVYEFCFCFFIYLIVQCCNFLDCHGFGLISMPSHVHFSSRIKSIKNMIGMSAPYCWRSA